MTRLCGEMGDGKGVNGITKMGEWLWSVIGCEPLLPFVPPRDCDRFVAQIRIQEDGKVRSPVKFDPNFLFMWRS